MTETSFLRVNSLCKTVLFLSVYISDFVTYASCIFCGQYCLWDAKFLFQPVPGCNIIADLSLKIVFWTHKFAVGLIDTETASKPKVVNESLVHIQEGLM